MGCWETLRDSRRRLADPRVTPAPTHREMSYLMTHFWSAVPTTLLAVPHCEEEKAMDDRLLRRREVEEITGLSHTSIYQFMKDGKFPQRVQVGPNAVRWRASDVAAWLDSRPLAGS